MCSLHTCQETKKDSERPFFSRHMCVHETYLHNRDNKLHFEEPLFRFETLNFPRCIQPVQGSLFVISGPTKKQKNVSYVRVDVWEKIKS